MDGSVSSDTCKANIGPVMLTKEWKQYTIDLRGKDLSNIISGLSWAIGRGENPQGATFYLDDVRFEQKLNIKYQNDNPKFKNTRSVGVTEFYQKRQVGLLLRIVLFQIVVAKLPLNQ